MQAYGPAFARVYASRWGDFSRRLAPALDALYSAQPVARECRRVLDVCCGTGHLAAVLCERGYEVTGLDLSPAMLAEARALLAAPLAAGRARLVQADAADFALGETFGLAVSTYDALNHLPDAEALGRCFTCVRRVLLDGGLFVFDLNTRAGLRRWNGTDVKDDAELTLVARGAYDEGAGRAVTRISGFVRDPDLRYSRFEETVHNTAFDLRDVERRLRAAGFAGVHFARGDTLAEPLADPEAEPRVFAVATR